MQNTNQNTDTKQKISDEELIEQIRSSHLRDDQKEELPNLVMHMTEEERGELIGLINESNQITVNTTELDKEYYKKAQELKRTESKYVREEFEKFDRRQSAGDFQEIEAEMAGTGQALSEAQKLAIQQAAAKKGKRHTVRNLILIILALIFIAAGILYGLSLL